MKWKYTTVKHQHFMPGELLDRWGAEGWELVAVTPGWIRPEVFYTFKRPL
jgi:hypothetical protein